MILVVASKISTNPSSTRWLPSLYRVTIAAATATAYGCVGLKTFCLILAQPLSILPWGTGACGPYLTNLLNAIFQACVRGQAVGQMEIHF